VLSLRGLAETHLSRMISATIAFWLLLAAWVGGVFVFQPFGHRHWALVLISLLLILSVARRRPRETLKRSSPTRLGTRFGRSLGPARVVFVSVLACSLGLVAWSAFAPAGRMPPAKSDPATIRVVTWNILVGSDHGMWWRRHGWPVRKSALKTALASAKPDILCVQEALAEQLRFLDEVLPRHRRIGAGRDDGKSAGEHCAIFFDGDRFKDLDSGTFWLSEPVDEPPPHTFWGPKRICSWARLEDRQTGRSFRVYNMHNYLTESARVRAVTIVLDHIEMGNSAEPVFVTGDFNASPAGRDRRLFEASGLIASAHLAGVAVDMPTYQFYGIRLRSLDEILVNGSWRVLNHGVLDVKPDNTYPSDHFGVVADLVLQ
jgi:endonuclease/exonuclease/phosphatase family metal-dependent hydrolase